MSITSYFFPISKGTSKKSTSAYGSVSRTNSEGKLKSRPAPYPETSERKSSNNNSVDASPSTSGSSNTQVSSTSNPDTTSFTDGAHPRYANLKLIAKETIDAIKMGSFDLNGKRYDLEVAVDETKKSTEYWSPNAQKLVNRSSMKTVNHRTAKPEITISEISSLEGARFLSAQISSQSSSSSAPTTSPYFSAPNATIRTKPRIGLLNFASATKPGGGFLNGASAQEESIARSSTLYSSLTTPNGDEFYKLHKRMKHKGKFRRFSKEKGKQQDQDAEAEDTENEDNHTLNSGFYTHAMIYSPSVLLFRDDNGSWLEPLAVDVLTSAAVNAGDIRAKNRIKEAEEEVRDALELRIEEEMKERMARILHLFALKGVRNLVLGSFGTGVFRNNVEVVAGLWKELLIDVDAPFRNSFDRVIFAVLGRATYETFEQVLKPTNESQADRTHES
ncbi:hypothetical protein FB446DRAFT_33459 [Lentinula raphanica]|nr:hypothetical protein FB446DRAFT_33459 [Lentinula raphanica]